MRATIYDRPPGKFLSSNYFWFRGFLETNIISKQLVYHIFLPQACPTSLWSHLKQAESLHIPGEKTQNFGWPNKPTAQESFHLSVSQLTCRAWESSWIYKHHGKTNWTTPHFKHVFTQPVCIFFIGHPCHFFLPLLTSWKPICISISIAQALCSCLLRAAQVVTDNLQANCPTLVYYFHGKSCRRWLHCTRGCARQLILTLKSLQSHLKGHSS